MRPHTLLTAQANEKKEERVLEGTGEERAATQNLVRRTAVPGGGLEGLTVSRSGGAVRLAVCSTVLALTQSGSARDWARMADRGRGGDGFGEAEGRRIEVKGFWG